MNNDLLKDLLIELRCEELPPKALCKLSDAFATGVIAGLRAQGLCSATSTATPFATPRRLAVRVSEILTQAPDKAVSQKLMPVAVGLDASGHATPALLKKLQALGADASAVSGLKRQTDGKAEVLFFESTAKGATLADGLQAALDKALAQLPIPKVMGYQLHTGCEMPGWSTVNFVRPAHGLVALYGSEIVPVTLLGLRAGRSTQGHRFEAAKSAIEIADANSYEAQLLSEGAVIASFATRRQSIADQLTAAAAKIGGGADSTFESKFKPIEDAALLDEVTSLVERPNVLTCQFEKEFLAVPQECLILTMKANQKYFPLLDAAGKLSNQFLVVSNITPDDASAVIEGNERVVRPRLADAKFFFDQDRKKTLESRVEGLSKVVYHNKLGTQGERMHRVVAIASSIVEQLRVNTLPYTVQAKDELDVLLSKAREAARLAKTDLLTDMVGEFPELQGVMGGYYARADGLRDGVAIAIEDHYKPRFAGDELPRNHTGVVVALADKLETLVGMFGIGNLPSGDKDPFALRRHALGVIRILVERNLPLDVQVLLGGAYAAFGDKLPEMGSEEADKALAALKAFFDDRFAGSLREQGSSAQEVDAVLSLSPERLGDVPKRLAAVRAFAALSESASLAAANKRVGNILKKAEGAIEAKVDAARLVEAPEKALFESLSTVKVLSDKAYEAHDYAQSLKALAALRSPVDAFFESVMVNAQDPALKANRLGLLATLHAAMNRVADLSKLAS